MRIAIVTAATWMGGVERVVALLANRWAGAGHGVRIMAFERTGEQPAFALDTNVEVEQLDLLKSSVTYGEAVWNNVNRIAALRRRLGRFAPDVTLAQATIPSILTVVAGIGRPWPTVATEHTHPAFHRLSRSWERLRRLAYPLADEIVVPTPDVAMWVGSELRLHAQVMPNPVDLKLDIIRHERPRGGSQAFWCCPTCGREVWHLYIRTEGLMCRKCAGLTYWSRQTYRRGLHRVRNLRRKLGAPPGLLAKVPPRPPHWRRDYWARTVAKLAAAEAVIAVELRDMVPRVRRRLRT